MKVKQCIVTDLLGALSGTPPGITAELLIVPVLGRSGSSNPIPFEAGLSQLVGYPVQKAFEQARALYKPGELVFLPATQGAIRGILFVEIKAVAILAELGEYYRSLAKKMVTFGIDHGVQNIVVIGDELFRQGVPVVALQAFVEGAYHATYRFTQCRGQSAVVGSSISQMTFVTGKGAVALDEVIFRAQQFAEGVSLARDIVLLPPNYKKPPVLAKLIHDSFASLTETISVRCFDKAELQVMGAGGILAVGQGSQPCLVRIEYVPPQGHSTTPIGAPQPRIALVGKGVIMDTGGYCIKPASGQATMKGDCAGAAAVVGAMRVIAALRPQISVVAYLPIVENIIDAEAMLTTDVITMLDGKTVEIIDTDAEGRLILADAITLACQEGATTIVDIATLTGGVAVALGTKYAALFATSDALSRAIITASEGAGERFWRLPLATVYEDELFGGVADLRNLGTGRAGTIVAALFLKQFVTSSRIRWAHLDIAGAARVGIENGTVPGLGVGTLARFVLSQG